MDGNSGENQSGQSYTQVDYFDDLKIILSKSFDYLHRIEALFGNPNTSMDQYSVSLIEVTRDLGLSIALLVNIQGSISIGIEGRYARDPNDKHSFKSFFHSREEDELPVSVKDGSTIALARSMVSQYGMLVEGTIQKIYQYGLDILHQKETFQVLRSSADLLRQSLDQDPVMRLIALTKCAPYFEALKVEAKNELRSADTELSAFGIQLIQALRVGYKLDDIENIMALENLSLRSRVSALVRRQPEVFKHIIASLNVDEDFLSQSRDAEEEFEEYIRMSNTPELSMFSVRTGRPLSQVEVSISELHELFHPYDQCRVLSLN